MFTPDERREPLSGDELRRRLAHDLLALAPGDRLPTVRALAGRHGASLGAVHQAVVRLEEVGAIEVDRRHGRGAVLLDRSPGRLWAEAEREPLVVSLPLPTAPRIQGLATAIKALLAGPRRRGLPDLPARRAPAPGRPAPSPVPPRGDVVAVGRIDERPDRGADPRAAGPELRARASGLLRRAAGPGRDGSGGRSSTRTRPTSTSSPGSSSAGRTPSSCRRPTCSSSASSTRTGPTRPSSTPRRTSWPDCRRRSATVRCRPARRAEVGDRNTRAAFVGRAGEPAVRQVLEACLDPAELLRIQADVIRRDRVPEY